MSQETIEKDRVPVAEHGLIEIVTTGWILILRKRYLCIKLMKLTKDLQLPGRVQSDIRKFGGVTIGRLEIPEGFVTRGNRGIKVSRGKLTFISDSRS